MSVVTRCAVPEGCLLAAYPPRGAYADCYVTEVPGVVSHRAFVTAFYTTWLFKFERFILRWAVSRPSTDAEAARLADGTLDRFAAWTVEGRADDEVLLCDLTGRTRSWLMVRDVSEGGAPKTRLYFGSAVVPRGGEARLGFPFELLLDFHKAYSVALLHAARARLVRTPAAATSA